MTLIGAINWEMNPVIVFTVRWYGVFFAAAFVCGFYYMTWVFKRENKPIDDLDRLLMYLVAGTIVGARLGHCIFYEPHLYFSHPSQWIDVVKVWKGGLASHGGAVGLYVGIFLYSLKRDDQPFLWCLDRLSMPVVFAGSLIRLGNLFNSEIVGRETDLPWAFVFKVAQQLKPEERLVPRHPAQLYESLSYMLVFIILYLLYSRKDAGKRSGLLHGIFLIGIFLARILVEFVKIRQTSLMESLPISMGQLLSLPFIVAGVWLVVRSIRQSRAKTDTVTGD